MQESNEIFEARLRAMLQDAEVKAPRGVWKGVRSQLDAATSWWKWASAGLVAACVMGAGLWFGVADRSASLPAVSPIVAEAPAAPELVASPEAQDIAAEVLVPLQSLQKASPKLAAVVAGKSEQDSEQDKQVAPDTQIPEQAHASGQGAASAASRKASGKSGEHSDPFADMEREDRLASARKARSRVALSLEGAAGGNDSDLGTYIGRIHAMGDGAASMQSSGITEKSASSYGIPFSLGLGVRFYVAPKLSIGTGASYSLLQRRFDGEYGNEQILSGEVTHTMHYVGVPLNLYYDPIKTSGVKFYVFGGGMAEYCVSNKYALQGTVLSQPVKSLQYSVNAGLGIEFKLAEHLGVFFDPSVRYYFPGTHPKSIRTDKPYMVNFEAGLRFSL